MRSLDPPPLRQQSSAHVTFSMTFSDSDGPLMPSTASPQDLRVCRKWHGVLVSCSLSMMTDKMLIDEINHSRRGTLRGTDLPNATLSTATCPIFRRQKFRERKSGSSVLPVTWCEAAFWGLLIESSTDRLVRGSQSWLWEETQP